MPRLLMIDNYDSFTYNLVQYLGELGAEVEVLRNDKARLDELLARAPDGLVISPGPGRPANAGVTIPAIRAFAEREIPVLGVCLGHQGIGEAFGGRVVGARTLMHGKTSWIHHDERGLFAGLPSPFEATRYHSLVIERESCPALLEIAAWTEDGEIMGVRHRELPVAGVQFHPESILTHEGKRLLANFLVLTGPRRRAA
jgi:anthranilate synthase component 2